MTTTLIHQGPAYELSVAIQSSQHGHHLQFLSFVPTSRRPEQQVRFQTLLSTTDLRHLHQAIGQALYRGGASASGSLDEPAPWEADKDVKQASQEPAAGI